MNVPYVSLAEARFPTYAPDALPDHLRGVPVIKPGSTARPEVACRASCCAWRTTARRTRAGSARRTVPRSRRRSSRRCAPLAGGAVTVTGAGRTDAGVHADGQAAHVDVPEGIDPDVVVRATNTRLPADIRVRSAALVPDDFHARFSAVSKTYRYAWLVSRLGHPLLARTHWLVTPPLDLDAMAAAAARADGHATISPRSSRRAAP